MDSINDWVSGNRDKKLFVFSGHDTGLFGLLQALNISTYQCYEKIIRGQANDDYLCPPMAFASNFVVEIFKETSGNYSARLAFNDKYYDVCNGNFIDKASFRCNVDSFLEILNKSNEDL